MGLGKDRPDSVFPSTEGAERFEDESRVFCKAGGERAMKTTGGARFDSECAVHGLASLRLAAFLIVGACCVFWASCGEEGTRGGQGAPASDELAYREIVPALYETLMAEGGYEQGRWAPDEDGSARLWAAAFLFPWGERTNDSTARSRARESAETVLGDLRQGPSLSDPWRPALLLGAGYAALSAEQPIPEGEVRTALQSYLDAADGLAEQAGFYLAGRSAGFGPTALTALLAWGNLLYRDYWDWPRASRYAYPGVGLDLLDGARQNAWDEEKGYYRSQPGDHGLDILTNAWTVVALNKAFENEELVRYQEDAEKSLEALQGLWDDAEGGYFSPEAPLGRRKTLEENNAAATALLMMYKSLGTPEYLERARRTLSFAARDLLKQGKLFSVLEDGAVVEAEGWSPAENFHFLYNVLLEQSLSEEACANLLGRRPMFCGARGLPGGTHPGAGRLHYGGEMEAILETLLYKVPWRDGDILYDYGDMPGYASWYLFNLARETGEAEYAERATAVADRVVRLIHEDLFYYISEISFGGFSLYAAKRYYGAAAPVYEEELDSLLGLAAFLARVDGYYLDLVDALTGGGSYGYGATTLTAQVAYLLFLSRYHPPEGFRPMWDEYPEVALRMVDAACREAWDEAGGYFYKSPAEREISLLADGYMVYALVEAYRYTGDAQYLDRAKRVVAALETLLGDPQGKGFYALPPAIPSLGYKSLSSSSYGFKACALLYQETGEEAYLDKAREVMAFLMEDLYREGIVYHHVYKGHACSGDIWCPGCNFRLLVYLDYLDDLEKNGAAATKDRP